MFAIGDFARLGRVSVRMLRHYDALGLLRPAHVDPGTGYRRYNAAQLARLNRIVALKDLGFTLDQVGSILNEPVDAAELRGMLRLRRAEAESELAVARRRLTGIQARLSMIEAESGCGGDVVVKRVPAVRVAELTAIADSYASCDITPVIRPLYARLNRQLESAGIVSTGSAVATYEDSGDGVLIHAALPVPGTAVRHPELTIVDLPAVEAATMIHHGSMDDADAAVQTLARWIDANGYRSRGYAREVNLECPPDPSLWVTEFQESITAEP